ncbi:hypothetical protein TrRE_jg7692 [Triparma retinervis]|uniref:UBC core domain-containing protein n=1 Tax=Triparma retinervis TaxID=2557542 RepID=A0A9W7G0I1_9STRA|nr:hypothetical protein TrRE_jg7692 [Triparma retinervis]
METPSGRFRPGRRLCLSMSDFHPETWNPMWSVGTILTGLFSFMLESTPTLGAVETTQAEKSKLALSSLHYNVSSPKFRGLFPSYVSKYRSLNSLPSSASVPVRSSGTTRDAATMLVGGDLVDAVERGVRRYKDVIAATGVAMLVLAVSVWANVR